MDPEVRDAIEGLLRDHRVVLFMKGNRAQPQCGFSAKTVAALDMVLPDYVAIDVLQNPDIREGIKAYGNWPTVPQLYVDGELIGGSDIVTEMFDSGELGSVLGLAEPAGKAPRIDIEPAAADIMVNALQGRPGDVIHLKITAGFEHSMSLGPPRSGSVDIASGPREAAGRPVERNPGRRPTDPRAAEPAGPGLQLRQSERPAPRAADVGAGTPRRPRPGRQALAVRRAGRRRAGDGLHRRRAVPGTRTRSS